MFVIHGELRIWISRRARSHQVLPRDPRPFFGAARSASALAGGRLEQRRHLVSHEVGWLLSDRRYPHEPRFPHLAAIAMVETRVERSGGVETERRYSLSSAKLDARSFACAVRAHRHVENRLHRVLDVVFHNDLARLRTANGPENMAVIRHMAMNLVRNPKRKHSLKVRRKPANLNPTYLESLIKNQGPLT